MEGIRRLVKITDRVPDFDWIDFKYITDFYYYIDYNKLYEEVSFLRIGFIIDNENLKKRLKVEVKFEDITGFKTFGLGGKYNQLSGFEVVDQKGKGWEDNKRYYVHDFEFDIIEFYCKSMEIISIDEI